MNETISPLPTPRVALILGVAGLIPFVGLAAALLIGPDGVSERTLHMALVTYGALIASFLGGVRWGNALKSVEKQAREYITSVIPSLLAWLALATPRPYDLMVLIGLFLALGVSDVGLVLMGGAPRWYGRLRVGLTAVATLSLLVALFTHP